LGVLGVGRWGGLARDMTGWSPSAGLLQRVGLKTVGRGGGDMSPPVFADDPQGPPRRHEEHEVHAVRHTPVPCAGAL
jgi:hypothetical protein